MGDEDIAKLKAKYENRPNATQAVTVKDIEHAREAGIAKATETQSIIELEKQKQAAKIGKRLADRKRRLQKKEAVTHQVHTEEQVRLELEYEKEKMQARGPLEQQKAKSLVRELHKVKSLIGKLQESDPGSPGTTVDSRLAVAESLQRVKSTMSAQSGTTRGVVHKLGSTPPAPPSPGGFAASNSAPGRSMLAKADKTDEESV